MSQLTHTRTPDVSNAARAAVVFGLLLCISVAAFGGLLLVFALSEHMWGWVALGATMIATPVQTLKTVKRNPRVARIVRSLSD